MYKFHVYLHHANFSQFKAEWLLWCFYGNSQIFKQNYIPLAIYSLTDFFCFSLWPSIKSCYGFESLALQATKTLFIRPYNQEVIWGNYRYQMALTFDFKNIWLYDILVSVPFLCPFWASKYSKKGQKLLLGVFKMV